jgi:hypothetical protein
MRVVTAIAEDFALSQVCNKQPLHVFTCASTQRAKPKLLIDRSSVIAHSTLVQHMCLLR